MAIKVLPVVASVDPERRARFEHEARSAATLNHPNVLAVYDIGTYADSPYIVSELLEGAPLDVRLRDGAVPLRTGVDLAAQVAHGLAAAHARDIVHRDLKPANVFVTADGRAKILDFGLAKLVSPPAADPQGQRTAAGPAHVAALPTTAAATQPGLVLGTVGYMAPEQVRGAMVDHRTDIFAFGVLVYEMVAGVRAFDRETPAETLSAILREDVAEAPLETSQVPAGLRRIVRRCLEKDPAARFQSALDLAFALEAVDTARVPPRARRTRVARTVGANAPPGSSQRSSPLRWSAGSGSSG